jgi:hypothetical protein
MLSPGKDALGHATYERHRPEQTLLYQLVEKHYPTLVEQLEAQGKSLPTHVHREFESYLKCGRLEHGFLHVRCDKCHFERLVAFSCKKRGFCPSCGARRMAETAALLSDEVFPDVPLRQWVISFPFPLRYLFAAHPQAMGKVLGIVYRAISSLPKTQMPCPIFWVVPCLTGSLSAPSKVKRRLLFAPFGHWTGQIRDWNGWLRPAGSLSTRG